MRTNKEIEQKIKELEEAGKHCVLSAMISRAMTNALKWAQGKRKEASLKIS